MTIYYKKTVTSGGQTNEVVISENRGEVPKGATPMTEKEYNEFLDAQMIEKAKEIQDAIKDEKTNNGYGN